MARLLSARDPRICRQGTSARIPKSIQRGGSRSISLDPLTQSRHNQVTVNQFNFAFINLTQSSFRFFSPSRVNLSLFRAVETCKQVISKHRSFAGREWECG